MVCILVILIHISPLYHRKKKITNYIKQVWPLGSPAPRFRNNPDASKRMHVVVDTLAKDEEFTLPRLGLRRNAIMQIIRKHMDERRRKESEQLEETGKLSPVSSSESESNSSNVSGDSPESNGAKSNKLEDYYNTGETCIFWIQFFWYILCCDN